MVQFISDRFAEFEVVSETEEGLKIPATSVTTKDFFTVPVEFAASGGDESGAETGFYKEVYSESGEASVVFTPAEIYGCLLYTSTMRSSFPLRHMKILKSVWQLIFLMDTIQLTQPSQQNQCIAITMAT